MVYKKTQTTVSWTQAITPQRTVDLDSPPPKVEHKNGHFDSARPLLRAGTGFCKYSQLKTALTFVLSLPFLLCFSCSVLPLTLLPGTSEMVDSFNEHNEQACSGHMIQCRNREKRNVSLYTCTPQGQWRRTGNGYGHTTRYHKTTQSNVGMQRGCKQDACPVASMKNPNQNLTFLSVSTHLTNIKV